MTDQPDSTPTTSRGASEMTAIDRAALIETLRSRAGHFEYKDWTWTRETGIRHIRYEDDYSGYNHPVRRLYRAIRRVVKSGSTFGPRWHPLRLLATILVELRTDKHLPDGQIRQAAIICYWEEDGEYLMQVQPSVGKLLADWLDADPDHPCAQAITAELARINARYEADCKGGE